MPTRKLLRLLVLALGLLFVVLSIAGFATISDETSRGGELQGGNPPDLLWDLFSVNTVLNFIHFLLGALTIATAVVVDRSKIGIWTISIGYALVVGYDIASLLVRPSTDPLAINQADLWLHVAALAVLLVVAFVPVSRPDQPDRSVPSSGSRPR
jgi:hypothetical protein